jgi:hypothetical protein
LCCSHVLVQSLGTYMYWTCMYLIHCLDPFPSFPSWTGKCEPDRCHLQRCRGQASRWEKDFAFLEKSLQAAAFHVMNFSAIQPCPCIRRGVLWQTGPSLRHQPVVQAILIASVHDTVALCTILPQWRRELDRFCLQIDMHRICLCTLLSKVMNRPNATILNFHVIEQPCFESSLSLSVFDHCWSQLKDVAGCFLLNSGKKPVGVVYTVSS